MAGTFVDTLTKLLPNEMTLAPELSRTFDWLESQGWMSVSDTKDRGLIHTLGIYPPEMGDENRASYAGFGNSKLRYTFNWSTPDPTVDARIGEIAFTSSDGARVAIWMDDAGAQWFVHLGHDTIGIISQDPIVLLQFLAIGYLEPGNVENTSHTAEQDALAYHGFADASEFSEDEGPPIPPDAFRAYVTSQFGVSIPTRASDLGIRDFVEYGTTDSKDPFVNWLNAVTPPPTEAELAYIQELADLAESMDLSEFDLNEDEKPKGILGKLKGLFGSNK